MTRELPQFFFTKNDFTDAIQCSNLRTGTLRYKAIRLSSVGSS